MASATRPEASLMAASLLVGSPLQCVAGQGVEGAAARLHRGVVGDDRPAQRVAQRRRSATAAAWRRGAADVIADLERLGVVLLDLGDDVGRHAAEFLVGRQELDQLFLFGGEGLEQRADLLAGGLALAGRADAGRALLDLLADRR